MPSPVWLLGLLILAIAVVVAREQFYDVHGRAYGSWQPFWKRIWAPPGSPASRVPRPALLRQDPDTRVERARRKYLVVLAAAVVLTLWGIIELRP